MAMNNLGAWKPLFLCKGRSNNVVEPNKDRHRTTVEDDGSCSRISERSSEVASKSSSHLGAQREFLTVTEEGQGDVIFNAHNEIPDLEEAYLKFKAMYPKFVTTEKVEELRLDEYGHLEYKQERKVCLDYCGFGLFSYAQTESLSIGLSQISANLRSHALVGISNRVEKDLRSRIMEFLNIPMGEYNMVFTTNRGSAFKLLAESYPFHQNRRLLTMYDYDSQSVNWMGEIATSKGAKVRSALFRWPTLRPCSAELKKELKHKKNRRKDSAVGMFVFPFQSRVTGAKYSSQWMAFAQQNGWHLLLDAGALGPKDMDSLGLSLFRPDFIITSFYKVFGHDPTGFGCLFIKNSVMDCLENQGGDGMVSIVPSYGPHPDDILNNYTDEEGSRRSEAEDEIETGPHHELPAFSGQFSSLQVRDVFDSEVGSSFRDAVSEDIDNASTLKSPIFSEDENDNSFYIHLGQSPPGSGPLRNGNSNHFLYKDPQKHRLTRSPKSPLDDEGNIDSSGVSSEAPVSSELDQSKDGADEPTLAYDYQTNGRCHKFDILDHGHSPSMEQEEGEGHGIARSQDGDLSFISEDDGGSSGRIGSSRRLLKQSKLSFILENAEAEGEDNSPKQSKQLGSTTNEIEICNEDTNDPTPLILNDNEQHHSAQVQTREKGMVNRLNHVMNGGPQLCGTKENAIRRETEGEFRLLGRRETGRLLNLEATDRINSEGRRVSFSVEEEDAAEATNHQNDEEGISDAEEQRESMILCRHMDHVDSMGLNKTTLRLRYLINWLVSSLLQLRHPGPDGGAALVQIYGPKVKYDRGAAIAFNLYDCKGALVPAEIVQRLADKSDISLGLGFLSHLKLMENHLELQDSMDTYDNSLCKSIVNGRCEGRRVSLQVEVVTASLGFLSNFEDVYRMWAFVAKFLDADFCEAHGCQSHLETER